MTRKADRLTRIEQALARLEESLTGHASHLREQVAAARVDASAARSSAEDAHAGVQALADMLPTAQTDPETAPNPPPAVPQAAGGDGDGEPSAAARRAPKTLRRDQGMLDGRGNRLTGGTS